jgi:hypothetical protein
MNDIRLNRRNRKAVSVTAETAEITPAPRSRNGKIARLPILVRNRLNQRLGDGQAGPAVLDWLNAQPEARAVLEESFKGVPVSLQNLSQWRQGGFAQWQTERNISAHYDDLRGFATDIEEGGPDFGYVADDLVTVLSAKYAQLVTAACGTDGGVTPQWEKQLRSLHPLLQDAIQLQRAMHRSEDHQLAMARAEEVEKAKDAEKRRQVAVALETDKLLNELVQKAQRDMELARQKAREEEEDEDEDEEDEEEEEEASECGSKLIKANQSQSNPGIAAGGQSDAAPQAVPAAQWPMGGTHGRDEAQEAKGDD